VFEGPGGLHLWAPQVALIVTHADVGGACTRGPVGEWVMEGESVLMSEIQLRYNSELMIVQQMFVMDARQPTALEMKYLRVALGEMKTCIQQVGYDKVYLIQVKQIEVHWTPSCEVF